jgi:hypothetical protein
VSAIASNNELATVQGVKNGGMTGSLPAADSRLTLAPLAPARRADWRLFADAICLGKHRMDYRYF